MDEHDDRPGILDGIRVVEFSQNAAVPHCGRLMAGLGAEVVKVEPPEGDAMRHLVKTAGGEGKAFAAFNTGKKGIVLDLRDGGARSVVDALFAWADVALVALKPLDLERYGIDWDHARTVNPRLIHLTHTALGPEGPDADHPGYDVLVQGRSGLGWMMNRSGGSAPRPTRPAINDFGTGFVSLAAVLAALRHRDLTGEGQRVDTSLLGTAISLATPTTVEFPGDREVTDELDEELAAFRSVGVPFDEQRAHYDRRVQPAGGAFQLYFRHYATADGLISVAGLSASLFRSFHEVTGLPEPTTRDTTSGEFQQLVAEAEALFASRSSEEWLTALRAGGYPCGPYLMPHEALRDPQVVANEYVVDVEHPTIGTYTTTGMPMRFERAATGVHGPSPRLGEHTRAVLSDIGLPADVVNELAQRGVVVDLGD